MDAIHGIVKDFVEEQLLKGPLAPRFANADVAQYKASFATQLCERSGGPCKYTGHATRDAELTTFVAAFQQSLVKFKVDLTEQDELLAVVRQYGAPPLLPPGP